MLNKGHGRKVTTSLDNSLLPVSNKAMTEALKAKLLWSGSFSSGSITVPNLDSYFLVLLEQSDGIRTLTIRTSDNEGVSRQFIGHTQYMAYGSSSPASAIYYRFGYYTANTLTIDDNCKGFSSGTLKAVYGLIKNPA